MNTTLRRVGRKDAGSNPPQDSAGLTKDEVQSMIQEAVKNATAGLDPAKLTEAIAAKLAPAPAPQPQAPPANQAGLTKEDVAALIKGVVDAVKPAQAPAAPATEPNGTQTKEQIEALIKAELAKAGKGMKQVLDDTPSHRIEMPTSWTAGNLPVHGKQLLNILRRKPMNDGIDEDTLRQAEAKGAARLESMRVKGHMGKALTSTGSGTGDELVPTDLSSELQRRLYLASDLVAMLAMDEVAMPTNPYTFPLSTTRPTFYLETTENTQATESTPGTGNVTLTAKKHMAKVLFSYEVEDDAIIPMLPWLERLMGEAAADALEGSIINGDDNTTHQDSDIAAVSKHSSKAYKGLRYYALAISGLKTDISSGGISSSNLRSILKKGGHYVRNKADCLWLVGPKGENDLLGLTEFMTVDKIGNDATIITGRVPRLFGIPVVTSAQCREDTNASGVYDGTTTTKGTLLLFNRRRFVLGRRGEFMVETERDIDYQQTKVVASYRRSFVPIETPSASITSVLVGYNYTA